MDISLLASEAESGSDFLTIDDLLDFSNEEIGGPIDSETATPDSSTPSKTEASMAASSPRDKSSPLHPPSVFDSEKLCVPCEDLEELEWLSNFVEESFSSGSDTTTGFCLSGSAKSITDSEWKLQRENCKELLPKPSPALHSSAQSRDKAVSLTCRSDMSAPARTRTKRGRTAVCFWNTRILSVEASESILESSSTASTITSDSDMINDTFYDHDEDDDDYNENEDGDGCDEDDDIVEDIEEGRMRHHSHHQHRRYASNGMMRSKKFNKGMSSLGSRKPKKFKMQAMARQPDVVRKCLHCATQKTPQWRAGPMGPKTLCNACGVRYKSGRLCAEYRPAASPTFIETMHSNSHRKVLEMRRQRGDHGANPSSFLGKSLQCSEGLST